MKKTLIASAITLIAVVAGVSLFSGDKSNPKSNFALGVTRPLSPISVGRHLEPLKVPPTKQELKTLTEIRVQMRVLRSKGEPDVQVANRQLLPLLQDSSYLVREEALRELARLESSEALPILLAKATELEDIKSATKKGTTPTAITSPSEIALRFAIARIQTKNLRGQERLDAIASSLGMKWGEVVALSKQDNRKQSVDLPDNIIVEEMIDVFYGMAKKGENIASLSSSLQLSEPQKIKLEAASLPKEQEAQAIVKYLAERRGAVNGDVHRLAMTHLTSLGESANVALFAYFDKVKALPSQEHQKVSYLSLGLLLRAAAEIGDTRLESVFDQIEKTFVERPKIINEISLARQGLKMKQSLLSEE